jgi:hypothetical protein
MIDSIYLCFRTSASSVDWLDEWAMSEKIDQINKKMNDLLCDDDLSHNERWMMNDEWWMMNHQDLLYDFDKDLLYDEWKMIDLDLLNEIKLMMNNWEIHRWMMDDTRFVVWFIYDWDNDWMNEVFFDPWCVRFWLLMFYDY